MKFLLLLSLMISPVLAFADATINLKNPFGDKTMNMADRRVLAMKQLVEAHLVTFGCSEVKFERRSDGVIVDFSGSAKCDDSLIVSAIYDDQGGIVDGSELHITVLQRDSDGVLHTVLKDVFRID